MMQRPVWQTFFGVFPQLSPRTFPASPARSALLALLLSTLTACQPSERATSEALTPEETEALLNQLPPLEPSDREDLPAAGQTDTPEAPVPDDAVEPAFGTSEAPADGTKEAPTIVRFSPEGEVDRASMVSITFSEPMVPVGSHAESLGKPLPVRIEPKVPGQWRWVDTRSLVFEPEGEALQWRPTTPWSWKKP